MSLEGERVGRYLLQNPLGSGGMGEVYLATDTHINRQVAIKVIRTGATGYPNAEATREAARLFQREMRAIALLDHPHILPLYDYGEDHNLTFMVMPYRKEGSLADWLQQMGNGELLSPHDVGYFVRQAASALQYAHNQHLIHQDVKPSNFLLRSDEEQPNRPTLLLADFGIAKFTSATSSISHAIRGTPAYMAPELWEGVPVPATDQYALAVMAYELLTGRPPFQGGLGQMMYQHFHVQPQPPSTYNPRIPRDLDSVLLHALAKKPEERFASIAAFGQAFQQALQSMNAPTVAKPPPTQSGELYATLAISHEEARTGTRRTLTLPGGRRVTVSIPANVQEGQVIRFDEQGQLSYSERAGVLSIKMAIIAAKEEARPPLAPQRVEEQTYLSKPSTIEKTSPAPDSTSSRQATKPRRGLSEGRVVLLIGLAVLIVVGSFGVYYFARSAATPNPYPPNTGTLLLNDSLSSNSSAWYQGIDNHGSCGFIDGAYYVSRSDPGNYRCTNGATSFSNFAYQVQMTIVKGDLGGIIFRIDSTISKHYIFLIGQDGSYELDLNNNNNIQVLKNGTSSMINTGLNQSNLIAVVANGSTIDLYVNLHHLNSVSDSTYTSGQIGVVAYSTGNPTEVAFNNAKVWGL